MVYNKQGHWWFVTDKYRLGPTYLYSHVVDLSVLNIRSMLQISQLGQDLRLVKQGVIFDDISFTNPQGIGQKYQAQSFDL